jgi:hypothetical protein
MALQTEQFTIGTTAIEIFKAKGSPRQIILHNAEKSSNTFIWFGGNSSVTTSTGAHLDNASTYQLVLQPNSALWAISDSSGRSLHVLWQDL